MDGFFSDPFVQFMLLMLALGVALGGWVLRAGGVRSSDLGQRLRDYAVQPDTQRRDILNAGAAADILRDAGRPGSVRLAQWMDRLAAFGNALAGNDKARREQAVLLAQAGYRYSDAGGLFIALKTLSGLALLLSIQLGWLDASNRLTLTGLAISLVAWFVGSLLPELYVKSRAARRAERLTRSVPDALDLMVICAEAGLPLGRIFKVVAREMALSAPVMAEELSYTEAELQLVSERSLALLNLAERTRVPAIESMVASLVQAERYGTPLAQALRTIADESRTTLILTLEERAGKLPAQLSLPLMTMILPPIVALMATPALVRVIRMLTE
ncbi:MAG: type II secretion system F family protein [Corticimicrobacter sp.]|uniref:type II secretion system F family protein n=1 Tax=Corticimicrobacter sp. TaxID=2678536 RepID=UPI0032DBC3D0